MLVKGFTEKLLPYCPKYVVKSSQLIDEIYRCPPSSNELQWLELKMGHQDIGPPF